MAELTVRDTTKWQEMPDSPVEYEKAVSDLTGKTEAEQNAEGYYHTLREILQQPRTWLRTSEQMLGESFSLQKFIDNIQAIVLTGSGSSEYAGNCVSNVLQNDLKVVAQTVGGGEVLTNGAKAIPPGRPALMISLARSGDSPESAATLSLMLETEPEIKHLIITCNRKGRLSEANQANPRVKIVVLDDQTNDRSLVMTSSFTNMVLASRSLGFLRKPEEFRVLTADLCEAAQRLLHTRVDQIAALARGDFQRALFLGTGPRFGAAREAALKMLEMTAGRITTMSETYLGLRHGPMGAVHSNTLIVCFLSSSSPSREYECDVIRELQRKQLGSRKILFGADIPRDLIADEDLVIECPALAKIGDANAAILDILIGQLLAFFRCMKEGLAPDCPAKTGVIHRVVENFAIHLPR